MFSAYRINMPLLPLRVAKNQRNLEQSDGTPFFWLADTTWNLLYRLTDEEITLYLETRREQGFNVLQIMLMSEQDLFCGNVIGQTPFISADVCQPNPDFWTRSTRILEQASQMGFYLALLPTWGEFVANSPLEFQSNPMFTIASAYQYALWLGQKFSAWHNIIWVLGGDRPAVHAGGNDLMIYRAMSSGLRQTMPNTLQTYHPRGDGTGNGVLQVLHEPWLDVVMYQSCHHKRDEVIWDWITRDANANKPRLDAEPCYEDHGINPWTETFLIKAEYFRDTDLRRSIYRSILAGGCGISYGHAAVWQAYNPDRYAPISYPDRTWQEALRRPAAEQMRYVKQLFRQYPDLIPAQEYFTNNPNEPALHARAAQHPEQNQILIYAPHGTHHLQLNLELKDWQCKWFNPRNGQFSKTTSTISPDQNQDWVFILEP
jgi:hypothetical protein